MESDKRPIDKMLVIWTIATIFTALLCGYAIYKNEKREPIISHESHSNGINSTSNDTTYFNNNEIEIMMTFAICAFVMWVIISIIAMLILHDRD